MTGRAGHRAGAGSPPGDRDAAVPLALLAPRWSQTAVAALGILFLLIGLAFAFHTAVTPDTGRTRLMTAAFYLAGAIFLLWRRRWPVWVFGVELAVALVAVQVDVRATLGEGLLLVGIALFAVAVHTPPGRTAAAAFVAVILLVVDTWIQARHNPSIHALAVLVPAAAVAAGLAVRSQRALLQSYRERAEQAEHEQAWRATRAVAAERARIARELHDVVAHHVSVLVVQAGAVRETLPPDHLTRPVLDSMIEGGRQAMNELRSMLGALRLEEAQGTGAGLVRAAAGAAEGGSLRSPQPTIGMVAALLGGARAAGLPVSLTTEGPEVPLPEATSLTAYRIVQEGVTNTLKHAPGAFTSVLLRYGSDRLEITVRNGASPTAMARADGGPSPRAAVGHGLIGMRERATLAGGTLTAGPAGDGWEVRAVLPIAVGGAGRVTTPAAREA